MEEIITYPNTFKEFIDKYSAMRFTDTKYVIYTDYVMQGWEHYIGLFKKAYEQSNGDLHMLGHYTKKILKDMGEI